MKTIAFDLDDVLCFRDETLPIESVIGPEKYEGCAPIPSKIQLLNECYDAEYKIILYTSRGMGQFNGDSERCEKELKEVTIRHLKKWGIKYHQLVFGKIHFDLLIDDKAQNSRNVCNLQDVERAINNSC